VSLPLGDARAVAFDRELRALWRPSAELDARDVVAPAALASLPTVDAAAQAFDRDLRSLWRPPAKATTETASPAPFGDACDLCGSRTTEMHYVSATRKLLCQGCRRKVARP